MVFLTDKGKYKIRCLFSRHSLIFCVSTIIMGMLSFFCFNVSSSSVKDFVANEFSLTADKQTSKSFNVILNFNEKCTKNDFNDVFNVARNLNLSNRNREKFSIYNAYSPLNKDFSDNYEYTSNELFENGEEIAILPSPYNQIIKRSDGTLSHEIWNISLMFDKNVLTPNDGKEISNFCFISIDCANKILKNRSAKEPIQKSQYESLLGETVEVQFFNKKEGTSNILNWTIANIVLDDEYMSKYHTLSNNILFSYTLLPSFAYPSIVFEFGHSAFACRYYLELFSKEPIMSLGVFSIGTSLPNSSDNLVNSSNVSLMYNQFKTGGIDFEICLLAWVFMLLVSAPIHIFASNSPGSYSLLVIVYFVGYLLSFISLLTVCYFAGIFFSPTASAFLIISFAAGMIFSFAYRSLLKFTKYKRKRICENAFKI